MKKFYSLLVTAALSVLLLNSISAYAAVSDTTPPGDVEELTVTPYDGTVKLSWDPVTDDDRVAGYVISYGTTSVDGETVTDYDSSEDVGNVKNYVLDGLTNDTEYFFSIYAYDAAGNESEYWAPEVSATPSEAAGLYLDEDAPQVAKAEAVDQEHVKVVFSEAVVLPEVDATAEFSVENDDTLEALDVLAAEMDDSDLRSRTVLLTTEKQEGGVSYTLVVNTGVKDEAENIIVSGYSDSAIFEGSAVPYNAVTLAVQSVEATDATHVLVEFNVAVALGVDPTANFVIAEKADATKTLAVTKATLGDSSSGVADASVLLETAAQADTTYTLTLSGVKDAAGLELTGDGAVQEFAGFVESGDVVGPEDVANFLAKQLKNAENYTVTLTWAVPEANKGLVDAQKLYMSEDKGTSYKDVKELEPDAVTYVAEDLKEGEYWFKLTQKGTDGTETAGSVVKVVLSETGPELLGLVLVSLGLGRVFRKKKARK